MIHIVCGIDDKFVMPCGVLMSSVFENNKNEQIEFHVITAGLKNESTNSLQKIADNYNQRLSFVVVDEVVFKDCPTNTYISAAAYNRILAANILPPDMKRCLYLDADIICQGTIEPLINFSFPDDKVAMVVTEGQADWWEKRAHSLGVARIAKGYFNSGF